MKRTIQNQKNESVSTTGPGAKKIVKKPKPPSSSVRAQGTDRLFDEVTWRARRAARVAAFMRNGGVLLGSGPVILLGWRNDARSMATVRREERARGARAQVLAALTRKATLAGEAQAERLRVSASDDGTSTLRNVEAALGAGERGEVAARLAVDLLDAQMVEHRVSKSERAAMRKARRDRARGSDYPLALRVSYALAVGDGSAHGSQAAADALDRMATASGRTFCATWTSNGGRLLTPSQTEEMACIFRAEFAAAAVRSGLVPPDIGSLFVVRRGNVLPFRALLIWRRALKAGMKRCRSSLWGKGGEGFVFLSLDALETSKALEQAGLNDSCASVSSARPADVAATLRGMSADAALGWAEPGAESTGSRARRRVRRLVGAWGDYLRAFWMLSGSRLWRYGMAGDLRLLRIAARVATGAGSVELVDWHGNGEAASDSLRDGLRKLRQHVAAGRLLCHGQTALAASGVLELARTVRLAPVVASAAEVRTGDLVSSSQ